MLNRVAFRGHSTWYWLWGAQVPVGDAHWRGDHAHRCCPQLTMIVGPWAERQSLSSDRPHCPCTTAKGSTDARSMVTRMDTRPGLSQLQSAPIGFSRTRLRYAPWLFAPVMHDPSRIRKPMLYPSFPRHRATRWRFGSRRVLARRGGRDRRKSKHQRGFRQPTRWPALSDLNPPARGSSRTHVAIRHM
jgi:hypothetical protein